MTRLSYRTPIQLGALVGLGCWLLPATAAAAEDDWNGNYELRAERRSGFAAGLGVGFGLGAGTGYPNEADKIDEPEYASSIDGEFGLSNTVWLGGALRDWFTFGLGFSSWAAKSQDLELSTTAYIVHLEAFPMWSLGGSFRDLALFANFGPGTLKIEGGPEDADGGLVSCIGFGVSHELFRWGHFALGPTLEGTYLYSPSSEAGGVFLGVRTAFYGGP